MSASGPSGPLVSQFWLRGLFPKLLEKALCENNFILSSDNIYETAYKMLLLVNFWINDGGNEAAQMCRLARAYIIKKHFLTLYAMENTTKYS